MKNGTATIRAPLKPIFLDSEDGKPLTGTDLLSAAALVQTAECPDVRGVGLYRSGLSSSVSSYYVWGLIDKSGVA